MVSEDGATLLFDPPYGPGPGRGVEIWRLDQERRVAVVEGNLSALDSISNVYCKSRGWFVVESGMSEYGSLFCVHKIEDGALVRKLKLDEWADGAAFSPDGKFLILAFNVNTDIGTRGGFQVRRLPGFDVTAEELVDGMLGRGGYLSYDDLSFSVDSSTACIDTTSEFSLLDLTSGRIRFKMNTDGEALLSPDGRSVCINGDKLAIYPTDPVAAAERSRVRFLTIDERDRLDLWREEGRSLLVKVKRIREKHLFTPDVCAEIRGLTDLNRTERAEAVQMARELRDVPNARDLAAQRALKWRTTDQSVPRSELEQIECVLLKRGKDPFWRTVHGAALTRLGKAEEALTILQTAESVLTNLEQEFVEPNLEWWRVFNLMFQAVCLEKMGPPDALNKKHAELDEFVAKIKDQRKRNRIDTMLREFGVR